MEMAYNFESYRNDILIFRSSLSQLDIIFSLSNGTKNANPEH